MIDNDKDNDNDNDNNNSSNNSLIMTFLQGSSIVIMN